MASKSTATTHPSFDEVEPKDARLARYKKLFTVIDTDSDGTLSRQELLERFTQMAMSGQAAGSKGYVGNMGSTAEAFSEALLARADTNNDGLVDWDEFTEFMTDQEKNLYALFCELDDSGDGELEIAEVEKACERVGFDASPDVVQRFMSRISTDGNHQISWTEFREAFSLQPNQVEFLELISFYQNFFEAAQGFDIVVLPNSSNGTQLHKWIACSAMSGIMSRTVNAPLDRLRVYLQLGGGDNQISGHPGEMFSREGRARMFQLVKESLNAISRDGGLISGLWRGNLLACMRIVPEAMARMTAIVNTRMFIAALEKPADGVSISYLPGKFATGAAGAFSATAFVYPMDVIQTRMMAVLDRTKAAAAAGSEVSVGRPHIIRETIKEMWRDGGFKSFYRGLVPTLVGIIPYAGTNITTFEFLKLQYMNHVPPADPRRPSLWSILGIGCISGTVAELVTYPISVVKSRMQSAGTQFNPETYTSTMDCVNKIYKTHGPYGFYRGIVPTLLKAAPGVGVGFTCFEIAKRIMGL